MTKICLFQRYILIGLTILFSQITHAGIRTVGNGGGLVEIILLDEFKSFPLTLEALLHNISLSTEEKTTLTKWKHLQIEILMDENSFENSMDLLKCNTQQVLFNQKELLKQNQISTNWNLTARQLIAQGYACVTKANQITLNKIQQLLLKESTAHVLVSNLKDLYQPDLGLYLRYSNESILHFAFIDSFGTHDIDWDKTFNLKPNESIRSIEVNSQNFNVFLGKIWMSVDIDFIKQERNQYDNGEIPALKQQTIHLQIELSTNLDDPQKAFDGIEKDLKVQFLDYSY